MADAGWLSDIGQWVEKKCRANFGLSCLDARTGTEHYQERLLGPCTASLLFADGHIYATDERGKTAVVVAGKTFQVLAMNELGEQTLASMAVCDNDLLIRTEKALYRVGRR